MYYQLCTGDHYQIIRLLYYIQQTGCLQLYCPKKMQSDDLDQLLQQIKQFLLQNTNLQGSFNLLARLDHYLHSKMIRKQSKQSQQQCEIEIIVDSEDDDAGQGQGQEIMISPRKFANLLDIFALNYSFQLKSYEIIPFIQGNRSQLTQNNRQAISQLILSPLKQHLTQKQKTASMTQLHKLTANVPKNSPPLILPNYSEQLPRYTYIYETKQCVEYGGRYYLVDRYYCFIVDGLAGQAVDLLYRDVKNRVFEARITRVEDSVEVGSQLCKECLVGVLPLLADRVHQHPLSLCEPSPAPWTEHDREYLLPDKTTLISSLLLLTTYLALSQYKLIFIVSKDNKHRLSQLLLCMEAALNPLRYVYPVVFCTLSKNHCDFVESPVPLSIGYWGNQRRRGKFVEQLQQYLYGQGAKGIPTLAIDLQKYTIPCATGVQKQDIFVLEKMNKYIHKYGKGKNLYHQISSFLAELLEDIGKGKIVESQWLTILYGRVRDSQMYHMYAKI